MFRKRIVGPVLLTAALVVLPAGAEELTFRPATEADLAITMDASRAPAATASFEAEAGCGQTLPRAAFVDLAWSGLDTTAVSAHRVDISKFPEGFATGRFETTGIQAASLSAVTVQAPEPALRYYWRVLTQGPGGWVSSEVKRFRVPVCRADVLEADQAAAFRLNDALATTPTAKTVTPNSTGADSSDEEQ